MIHITAENSQSWWSNMAVFAAPACSDCYFCLRLTNTLPHGPTQMDGRVHSVGHSLRLRSIHFFHIFRLRHTKLLQKIITSRWKKGKNDSLTFSGGVYLVKQQKCLVVVYILLTLRERMNFDAVLGETTSTVFPVSWSQIKKDDFCYQFSLSLFNWNLQSGLWDINLSTTVN